MFSDFGLWPLRLRKEYSREFTELDSFLPKQLYACFGENEQIFTDLFMLAPMLSGCNNFRKVAVVRYRAFSTSIQQF